MIKTSPGGSMGIETCSGVSFDSALRHACNHWILKEWTMQPFMKRKSCHEKTKHSRTSQSIFSWPERWTSLASCGVSDIGRRPRTCWLSPCGQRPDDQDLSWYAIICHDLSWFVMICHDLLWSVMIVMKSYHHWPFRHSRWFDQHWPPCAHEREHKQQATCSRTC